MSAIKLITDYEVLRKEYFRVSQKLDTAHWVVRKEYFRVSQKLDTAQQVVLVMRKQLDDTQDELNLALEALRRAFPENQS